MHTALQSTGRNAHTSDRDVEALATVISFVTSLARAPFEQNCCPLQSTGIPYTTASAIRLAANVRHRFEIDNIEPLLDLPSRLARRLGTLVFPVSHEGLSSACAVFDRTAFLFISRRLEFEQLYTCAQQFANVIALSLRNRYEDFVCIEPPRPIEFRGNPRSYFSANFANELLVPTRGLGIAMRKVRQLLKVKQKAIGDIEMLYAARIFGVPFSAIARRCERTQLLPLGGAAAMERFLQERFNGP